MTIRVTDMTSPAAVVPPQAVTRINKDVALASVTLSGGEVAYLVDAYYRMQNARIRAGNQRFAATRDKEPHALLSWLHSQNETLEDQIKRALDKYTLSISAGQWARAQVGIGPVLCAGLVSSIDITKAPTVGHIWAFAGLDPTKVWEKGQKRPWNPRMKVLCWKAGQSFMKNAAREGCYYGLVYRARKDLEWENNLTGKLAGQAEKLAERYGDSTDAKAGSSGRFDPDKIRALRAAGKLSQAESKKGLGAPGSGVAMLSPAHIDARARRYAVKLFLAHLHEVMYVDHYGTAPPLPYPIAHLQHAHYIAPPPGGEPATMDDEPHDDPRDDDA